MELHHLGALLLFAFVSTATPGPNNIMLMSSGANVGFRKTIPHMLGITIGFAVMLILVGVGLIGVFNAYPQSHTILKYVSLGYLLYLAVKIATSGKVKEKGSFTPMSFLGAASFQWVNPKGWSMALTAIALFSATGSWWELLVISGIFTLANIPSVTLWTLAGMQLQRWLTTSIRIKSFNVGMASLLLLSAVAML
ncbi:LysE family translocator [Vibrio breoganii]|uniref:Lysine transporter LysE n=1 Tax=Vibrio breoganii TaxID=553239 RepID=A0AAJ5JQM6_9VIBR|nr:LysE family translocator [Vibrio breoganii]OCH74173.1 lysine transporter LysE [Vibrio breoganii]PMF99901.1 lysine transporter LysE [Vibrio breoganii]PMG33604.1 lysine transporter LysE [Vibrio breoganii]PMG76449.1 lysine transporter LysE [Vibrio breoganii]PMG83159.1 lysine transporter LysE [Vibrio breoganii]